MTQSALTALVFEEASDGKLEVKAIVIRPGRSQDRLTRIATNALSLFAREVGAQDRQQLEQYNPSEPDA